MKKVMPVHGLYWGNECAIFFGADNRLYEELKASVQL